MAMGFIAMMAMALQAYSYLKHFLFLPGKEALFKCKYSLPVVLLAVKTLFC